MLRYFAYGPRDFSTSPVLSMSRFNWEFYASLKGALRPTGARLGGVPFSSKPTLWVFPPELSHGWETRRSIDRVVFHFSSVSDVLREACSKHGYLSVTLEPEDVVMLRELGKNLKAHYRSPTPTSLLLFDRALIDLTLLFLRGNDFSAALPLETVAVDRVERVIEWYLSHLHERPTLKALADVVHISTAHLRRQFQLIYGQSPHLVLRHLRLEKAAQLLSNTGDTLDVVAGRSGFNSASDLCRVFKRKFKVYPNEWRTQIAGKEKKNQKVERFIDRIDPMRRELETLRKRGGRTADASSESR